MATETTQPRKPPAAINGFAKFVLSSPLHVLMSKRLILLTFTGRKSGKSFTLPIGYQREGNSISCFTDHKWWRNLQDNPGVIVRLQGKDVAGQAEVVREEEVIANELSKHIANSPMQARAFSVELDESKRPVAASLHKVAQNIVMVRIHLL